MTKLRALFAASFSLAIAIGCHKDSKPTAYGGGPQLQANIDSGIARVAAAKCDRAQRCNHIGPGETYATREQCETVMRGKLTDDIRPKDCRGGIDENELQQCITEVRTENCGNVLSKLESHSECRVSQLCYN